MLWQIESSVVTWRGNCGKAKKRKSCMMLFALLLARQRATATAQKFSCGTESEYFAVAFGLNQFHEQIIKVQRQTNEQTNRRKFILKNLFVKNSQMISVYLQISLTSFVLRRRSRAPDTPRSLSRAQKSRVARARGQLGFRNHTTTQSLPDC